MKHLVVLTLAILILGGFANASITPVMNGSPVSVGSSDYQYNYSVTVDPGQQLAAGSYQSCAGGTACGTFFTIYDFQGYLNNTAAAPTGWTPTLNITGSIPKGAPTENSVVDNLVFMYSGANLTGNGQPITGFSAQSIFGTSSASGGRYSYQFSLSNAGFGSVGAPLAIPEPTSLALIGGGLIGLAFLRRRLTR